MNGPLLPILLALSLAACGFQLREEVALPPRMEQVRVEVADPFSLLARDLGNALRRAGAEVVSAPDAAVLRIPVDRIESAPLIIGASGRVQEYVLRYHVEFDVLGPDGGVIVPRQVIELTREYTFDTAQALGSPAEEEVMREELRREMVSQILRRIETAPERG